MSEAYSTWRFLAGQYEFLVVYGSLITHFNAKYQRAELNVDQEKIQSTENETKTPQKKKKIQKKKEKKVVNREDDHETTEEKLVSQKENDEEKMEGFEIKERAKRKAEVDIDSKREDKKQKKEISIIAGDSPIHSGSHSMQQDEKNKLTPSKSSEDKMVFDPSNISNK